LYFWDPECGHCKKTTPKLEDNIKYNLDFIYTNYIESIARNIDIYGLSLFIYQLFIKIYKDLTNFNYNNDKKINVQQILKILLINALYNNIDGPEELIIYLEGIIDTINHKYSNQQISNKIKERRNLKDKIYIFYYSTEYYVELDKKHYKY
jgi:thiol-disulfide isomerase/thioredoxin